MKDTDFRLRRGEFEAHLRPFLEESGYVVSDFGDGGCAVYPEGKVEPPYAGRLAVSGRLFVVFDMFEGGKDLERVMSGYEEFKAGRE